MIQKTELRIGNEVSLFDFTATITWLGITTLGYEAEGNKTSATYALLNPIPLTPDILEKCGFVRVSVGYNLKNSVFSLYQSNNPNRQNILPCWNEQICSDVPVKYLHQLQNLIFTLTGSELTLTL